MNTTRIEKTMPDLANRLANRGFNALRDVTHGEHTFTLVAHRSRYEPTKFGNMDTFFIFSEFETIDRKELNRFSESAFKYALDSKKSPRPRGLFGKVICFAVANVDTLDDSTAASVKENPLPKHWASFEIPVVYARGQNRVYLSEKVPGWGGVYYAGFRQEVNDVLGT